MDNEPNFESNDFSPKVLNLKSIFGVLLCNQESMGHKCLIPEASRADVGLWSCHALAWTTRESSLVRNNEFLVN